MATRAGLLIHFPIPCGCYTARGFIVIETSKKGMPLAFHHNKKLTRIGHRMLSKHAQLVAVTKERSPVNTKICTRSI